MPKIIHYRDNCIGCGICYEMQPVFWRMSKKDGKASLIKAIQKRNVYILNINEQEAIASLPTVAACPVNIIKVNK